MQYLRDADAGDKCFRPCSIPIPIPLFFPSFNTLEIKIIQKKIFRQSKLLTLTGIFPDTPEENDYMSVQCVNRIVENWFFQIRELQTEYDKMGLEVHR